MKSDSGAAPPADANGVKTDEPRPKVLPPAALRALAEAKARRIAAAQAEAGASSPKELQGPAGPEPTRYGDWEKNGIASDF